MNLAVQDREKLEKNLSILRQKGLVPAEVYGRGFSNKHVAILLKDFMKVFKEAGENTIINLECEKEKWPVLIYNIQKDRLSGEISHIDFYKVTMSEKIKSHIPLEFIGESPVIKEKRGILNKAMAEIEVEALPDELPHRINVDLSVLDELHKSIYAGDLKVAAGVRIIPESNTVIVTVIPPQKEEEVVKPVDVSEVKVEGEEKRAEKTKEEEGEDKGK